MLFGLCSRGCTMSGLVGAFTGLSMATAPRAQTCRASGPRVATTCKSSSSSADRIARHKRIRKKVSGTAERPRLAVFRSNNHIYAQLVDDVAGVTLAAANSLQEGVLPGKFGQNKVAAAAVGKAIAAAAKAKNVETVVFDRGGYVYHGRVAALADAARDGGLNF